MKNLKTIKKNVQHPYRDAIEKVIERFGEGIYLIDGFGNDYGGIEEEVAILFNRTDRQPSFIISPSMGILEYDGETWQPVTRLVSEKISAEDLADLAVLTDKIADKAVTRAKIADEAISNIQIAEETITADEIKDATITKAKLATDVQTSLGKADSAIQQSGLVSYIEARGDNLITNGNGMMGNNYNFPELTFDPLVINNCKGSFRATGQIQSVCKEKSYIDFESEYTCSFDVKADKPDINRYIYCYVSCFDTDNLGILPEHYLYQDGTMTTLAKELKNGDMLMYLTSVKNWNSGTDSILSGVSIRNYKDSFGYEYGEEYSRNLYLYLFDATTSAFKDETNNTIKLSKAWDKGTIPAGTKICQPRSSETYSYISYFSIDGRTDWIHTTAKITKKVLRPATRTISLGFLCQWPSYPSQNMTGLQAWLANVTLSKTIVQNTDDEANKAYVDGLVGNISSVLTNIIGE